MTNMKRMTSASILVVAFASCLLFSLATAEIKILYPGGGYYAVADAPLEVHWVSTNVTTDPKFFSIYLENDAIPTLHAYALKPNVDASSEEVTIDSIQDTLLADNVADGYVLYFTKFDDVSVRYAQSAPFSLKPKGTQESKFNESDVDEALNNASGNSSSHDAGSSISAPLGISVSVIVLAGLASAFL